MSAVVATRPSPAALVPLLAKHNIEATADGDVLHITTGKGKVVCLALTLAADPLPMDALTLLNKAAQFVSDSGAVQYFFRCDATESTRKLTNAVTVHGENDSVTTYPTPGWNRVKGGTFTDLPVLSWRDYCRIVEMLLAAPIPSALPAPSKADAKLLYQTMNPTQDNVARAFEDLYKDELRYCNQWGEWLIWDNSRWKPEKTLLAFHYCREISRDMNQINSKDVAKSSFARGVESFARASRTFATVTEQWDANNWALNTPNGTIDLRDGQVKPFNRSDHITKCTHVSPADVPRPHFDVFMQEITLGDEALSRYLQVALGACLSGAIQDNFLLFWYGTGQNGKNTLGDLIEWILGDYVTVLTSETLMAPKGNNPQHLTFVASLRGARVAISSEIEEGSYFNEQRIKSLTGDATITANRMRQDPFTFPRTHKHIIYGNHRPMLRIVDPAIKSRLHIVPFKAYFSPDRKDVTMAHKLRAEAPSVLQWLIDGHSMWLEAGRLIPCSAVEKETESYFDAQSTPDMWIAECCVVDPEAWGPATALYKSFKAFKESRGEGAMSQTRWGEWMSTRFDKTRSNGVKYRGIDLKAQSVLDYSG